ncbi:phosphotransferase family protein [Viridibacillus soli]|uniref:phosphotransferase family protein n=1 Tax=Viridibacillus soli TaxID=2798301 RepID=UPI002D7F0146|nr:aminoglycoside phosphotransferase family protein [Viridibacillus soli]
MNIITIENVPKSFSSEVYKIGLTNNENVYIKIPFIKDKLFREYTILKKLESGLPVPRALDYWTGDETNNGALLLTEIKGSPCTNEVDARLAYQIGLNHAMHHEVSFHSYGYEEQNGFQILAKNDWRLYIKNLFYQYLDQCEDLITNELIEKSENHFSKLFTALPQPDGPSLVHLDFRPGNILINEKGVAGIIDFESARAGSTEIDFTKINRDIWGRYPGTRDAYIAGYEKVRPIIDLERILPFYSFFDAVGSIAWCSRRGIEKHKDFFYDSVSILRTVVK